MNSSNILVVRPAPGVVIEINKDDLRDYKQNGIKNERTRAAWSAYLRVRRLAFTGGNTAPGPRIAPIVHGTERCWEHGCERPECVRAGVERSEERRKANPDKQKRREARMASLRAAA